MWSFLVGQIRLTILIVLLSILAGVFAINSLPKEASPEVKVPYASVTTIFPGASPLDIEELITDPLEDRILNLEDLKSLNSSSSEGVSILFAEFETSADIKDRVRALQDAVQEVQGLPEEAEDPIVQELNFSNEPVLIYSFSSSLPHTELVSRTEELQEQISQVLGASRVEIEGIHLPTLNIELDPKSLVAHQVNFSSVLGAIRGSELNLPLGTIESSDTRYSVRFDAKLPVSELENIQVSTLTGGTVFLSEIASIQYGITEGQAYSKVSIDGKEAEAALTVKVYKRVGGDIVEMVEEINSLIAEYQKGPFEPVDVVIVYDAAEEIRDQLDDLSIDGLQTIGLIAVVLFFILGFMEAVLAAIAIPLTFLLTFTVMSMLGHSINFLSLFSLILSMGILVDTGIVITEGMHNKIKPGVTPKQAALDTIEEYKWPLIAGTFATIVVFFPMLFMTGIIGEFVKHIPRTIIITLLASLVVCLAILPSLGQLFLKEKKSEFKEGRGLKWLKNTYEVLIRYFLVRRYRQVGLIFTMVIMFFASFALPITGILEVTMFPETDYKLFNISVELPKGSPLERTEMIVEKVEKELQSIPEIQSYTLTLGSSGSFSGDFSVAALTNTHLASFSINLKEERERSSLDIMADLRKAFASETWATIEVIGLTEGPPSASPIEFRIFGSDILDLRTYANEAVQVLDGIEGVENIHSSTEENQAELVLNLDREQMQSLGVSPAMIAQEVRMALSGLKVMTLKVEGEDTDVILKAELDEDIRNVLSFPISTPYGSFPLNTFVDAGLSPAPTTIEHLDGDRMVTITADLNPGLVAATILEEFKSDYTIELPSGYYLDFGGEAEELTESFTSLGRAMFFGLFLLLMLLLIEFNSFRESFIILFTIPLALIGVFAGLSIMNLPFSFPAFIGVVGLGGVVVNNAIILIDCIDRNRREGMTISEAIVNAGRERIQPILLTSITTIIGLLPLALSDPSWAPLGISIMSGMLFSTFLTLVVVPAMYELLIASRRKPHVQTQDLQ